MDAAFALARRQETKSFISFMNWRPIKYSIILRDFFLISTGISLLLGTTIKLSYTVAFGFSFIYVLVSLLHATALQCMKSRRLAASEWDALAAKRGHLASQLNLARFYSDTRRDNDINLLEAIIQLGLFNFRLPSHENGHDYAIIPPNELKARLEGCRDHPNAATHHHCLSIWLRTNPSCPICRAYLFSQDVASQENPRLEDLMELLEARSRQER